MTYPNMIIFDYGDTLLWEPDVNTLRGEEALFSYITSNKRNLSAKEVNDFAQKIFQEIGDSRNIGYELHEWQYQRFLYEYLEIELSISWPEAEEIFWYNMTRGAVMPGADKMLDYINLKGIRSGVISNIGFSGEALTRRLNRLLPNNRFEFVMASSEYMFRKPNRLLFELALKKAGLKAGEVWFCGDNIRADVEGSANVGIFPVWYENLSERNQWRSLNDGIIPACDHLHIHDWSELIETLEKLDL